jgi:hypothetical protein
MKTPSIAVFDAHVDSIMPQERDNPFLGTNEIAESFIENLSYGTVYPSFGNPKAWYHIPSLVRERQDVTNNPGRSNQKFFRRDYDSGSEEYLFRDLHPSEINWLHVCADSFTKETWDNAAGFKWCEKYSPPTWARLTSSLGMEELKSYIEPASNLKQLGLYHAHGIHYQNNDRYSLEQQTSILKQNFRMIGKVAKEMLGFWSPRQEPEIMIMYTKSEKKSERKIFDMVDYADEIESVMGRSSTKVRTIPGWVQNKSKNNPTTIRHPVRIEVQKPNGDLIDITPMGKRVKFTKENDSKYLFVVGDHHGYVDLTMIFRY